MRNHGQPSAPALLGSHARLSAELEFCELPVRDPAIFDGESMLVKGKNGQIEILRDSVVIYRKGFTALVTQGLKGEKRIPFGSITAVQFKKPGWFTRGYIQISILGGVENRRGVFAAVYDENSILFARGKQARMFEAVRQLIEQRMGSSRSAAASQADEIEKFAALHARGILSDAEFAAKKRRLLEG